jgi:hypothetical protein
VAADAGRGDACGCRYLLGGAVMADIVFSSSRVPGENLGFGTPDHATAAPRRRDLLEDVVKVAREGADVLECGVARSCQCWVLLRMRASGRNVHHGGRYLVDALLKSGWFLLTSRRSLLGV